MAQCSWIRLQCQWLFISNQGILFVRYSDFIISHEMNGKMKWIRCAYSHALNKMMKWKRLGYWFYDPLEALFWGFPKHYCFSLLSGLYCVPSVVSLLQESEYIFKLAWDWHQECICKRASLCFILFSCEREFAFSKTSMEKKCLCYSFHILCCFSSWSRPLFLFRKWASSSSGERVRVLSGSLASVRLPSEIHPWVKSASATLSI